MKINYDKIYEHAEVRRAHLKNFEEIAHQFCAANDYLIEITEIVNNLFTHYRCLDDEARSLLSVELNSAFRDFFNYQQDDWLRRTAMLNNLVPLIKKENPK